MMTQSISKDAISHTLFPMPPVTYVLDKSNDSRFCKEVTSVVILLANAFDARLDFFNKVKYTIELGIVPVKTL